MKSRFSLRNRRGVSEIIGVVLLLLVLSVVGSYVYMWGINYTERNIAEYAVVQKSQISMEFYDSNTLYVKSISDIAFNYTKLIVSGIDCELTGTIYGNNLTSINLGSCTAEMEPGPKEILLYSNNGVFREMKTLSRGPCTLDGITRYHGENYTFYNSSSLPYGEVCSFILRTCNDGTFDGDDSFNSSSCSVDGQDTMPDAFSFINQNDVGLSTVIISNTVVPTGFDGPLSVGVTGDGSAQLSVNGGSWVSSGQMNEGDTLAIRLTSSPNYITPRSATLILGDYSTIWNVTTSSDPAPCLFKDNKTGCESYYELKELDGKTVVHDTLLGLYWEQNSSYTGTYNWSDAKNYCEVTLGNGWRLPTLTEMEISLVDTDKASAPYIVGGSGGSLFSGIFSNYYWTNSKYSSGTAYNVNFGLGYSNYAGLFGSYYVLCVKEDGSTYPEWQNTQDLVYEGGVGQERVSSEFLVDDAVCGGAGTMYDDVTNLCWEQSPSTSSFTWESAVTRCSGLATAGGDWRLPEKAELMTLLKHAGSGTTFANLNSIGFSGIQNNKYWSNTKYANNPSTSAYSVRYDGGHSGYGDFTLSYYVLCVKETVS